MQRESQEFGSYHLIRRLGVGGMAETFEAARLGPGGFAQHVCLKRVLPAYSDDRRFIERFHREARLAAQLRHSNVVGVVDFGDVSGAPYMALELVDGLDLRSFLGSRADKRLPADWVVLLGLDLACALEHAHHPERAVVHRDISPSNILLGRAGEAKLADFGLAKTMGSEGATASHTRQGKIPYMAPEHIRGESVDGRADLFSLGVVLFEALTGRRPFDGAHDVETMQRILSGQRSELAQLRPDAPVLLRQIIEGLIATDRDLRPSSASTLVDALSELCPALRTRGELASVIEQQRGGPESRKHVQVSERKTETETVTLAALRKPSNERSTSVPGRELRATGKRRPGWIAAATLIVAALTLVFGLGTLGRSSTLPSKPLDSELSESPEPMAHALSVTKPELAEAPREPSPPPGQAQATTRPSPAPKTSRGRVRVVVQPWGNVSIDDRFMGRAPFAGRLAEGRHVVAVGQDRPVKSKVIELAAGSVERIELDLER